jgi:PAS domain S-box-containing protein
VFDEAAIGMATMTLTGRVVRTNAALTTLVGVPREALVGTAYPTLAAPSSQAGVAALLARLERGEQDVGRLEHPLPHRKGRVLVTFAAVKDAQGRPLYLFAQVQDVSAQRLAERERDRSEERFRLLVDAVEDYAIFMLDPTGLVASWNAGAERIKGYRADEIVGRHFREFYPPDRQAERHPEHELEVALREGHYQEEGWRIRRDGTRFWANVTLTAVRNDAGEHIGFAKVTRDLTGPRQAQVERDLAAAALDGVNRSLEDANEALGRRAAEQAEFLAVTAHELRSPITVLSGSATMLSRHWEDLEAGEREEMFAAIAASGARLSRLLGDLLMASRLEAGSVALTESRTDLASLLSAAATATRAARPLVPVEVECPPGVVLVTDTDRLAQAVDNLITNAVRHGEPPVRLVGRVVGDRAEVRVSDSGPGVPEEVRPRLFERFVSGERRTGTGLGLHIVRELSRVLGGDAWYEHDASSGATFVVSVPLGDRAARDAPP